MSAGILTVGGSQEEWVVVSKLVLHQRLLVNNVAYQSICKVKGGALLASGGLVGPARSGVYVERQGNI